MFKIDRELSNKIVKYTKAILFATTFSLLVPTNVDAKELIKVEYKKLNEKNNINNDALFGGVFGLIGISGFILLCSTGNEIKKGNNNFKHPKYKLDYDSCTPLKKKKKEKRIDEWSDKRD